MPDQPIQPPASPPWPKHIVEALSAPSGARFYRAAFQVNPYAYLNRHAKQTRFLDEHSYNTAIVDACKANGVEVIAVTDHYRIRTAESLINAATAAGIHVFPGFEACSYDGIHFLCIFEKGRSLAEIERIIGDCGIHDDKLPSPTGNKPATGLIEECHRTWGGVCIAAHVLSDSGVLHSLQGQPRMNVWRHEDLLACSIAGEVATTPQDKKPILQNVNPDYKRNRVLAILNSQDVSDPADLLLPSTTTWIKMSDISLNGLRLAFLDPGSRLRLNSDPSPEEHTELLAIAWQGGFLDGVRVHFNENLNALIGGRGTGKSTVIESLRFVLNSPTLGEEAKKQFDSFVKNVLKNGTTVSVLVRSHYPAKSTYLIERTVGGTHVVKDASGLVLKLIPSDVLPETEVFGQHEILELTKSAEQLTQLIDRFVERDQTLAGRRTMAHKALEDSRTVVTQAQRDSQRLAERLAKLPVLEEKQARFQKAGLDKKLHDKTCVVKEQALLEAVEAKAKSAEDISTQLGTMLPLDTSDLEADECLTLPGITTLSKTKAIIASLSDELADAKVRIDQSQQKAVDAVAAIRKEWEVRKMTIDAEYVKLLRELQKQDIDGNEFIQVERELAELRPLALSKAATAKKLDDALTARRTALANWESIRTEQFRETEKAAKKVSRQLSDRVAVDVAYAANRNPLAAHLRSIGGRIVETVDALCNLSTLSLSELASHIRSGRDALAAKYGIPKLQADALVQAGEGFILTLEELDLPAITTIKLNVAPDGMPAVWKNLPDLSTGQKATAVLLLLLLESDGPLILDQPEDDLDNRFITEGIVPKMREEKRRRQFIFATHNANIPVLGDAELIVGLAAASDGEPGSARVPLQNMGSIDCRHVKDLVEEILEGGRNAFEMRRLKYGF